MSSPEIGEWAVAVQRGKIPRVSVAVREEDDGEIAPGHGGGNSHLQIHAAPRS
nr:hypothetical protein [Ktedonobacter sp. SOSP1-85]